MPFDDFVNKYYPAAPVVPVKSGVAGEAKERIRTGVAGAFAPKEKAPEMPIWHELRQILG